MDSVRRQERQIDYNGSEDNIWLIDLGGQILFNVANEWREYPSDGRAMNLAVSKNGDPYIIGTNYLVYRGAMVKWELVPGAAAYDIAVDSTGTVWIIGFDYKIWYLGADDVWKRYGGAKKGEHIVVV